MYLILEKTIHEKDWYVKESLEEVKEMLIELISYYSYDISNFQVFKIEKEIEIKLNEVDFKGLAT